MQIDSTPPDPPSLWHPKIHRMIAYWESLRVDGRLPGRRAIDPAAIRDLLPGVWMLDVHRDPFRLKYRLVGTRVVEAIGQEPTGRWVEEIHPHATTLEIFMERYRRVVDTGIPSRRRGTARLWSHDDYREIENIVLPLATDGINIDTLLILTVLHRADGTSI